MTDFPPNSRKVADARREPPKRVEQVTSAAAVRRKRGLGKQFKETFIGGSLRGTVDYMIADVIIPSAKDALVEAVTSGFEKLVHGDSARTGRRPGAVTGYSALGSHTAYNRMSQPTTQAQTSQPRALSRASRARHSFDEIVIQSRAEAEEVLDQMYAILETYGSVSVADLYELTGIQGQMTDVRWGWRALKGSRASKLRTGGYLLELPQPTEL